MNKGYLNGVYQAKTLSILNDDTINHLKDLNGEQFLKHLEQINYNSLGNSYNSLDESLDLNLKEVRQELDKLTNNKHFGDCLFYESDLVNYKIVYKSITENVGHEKFINSGKYSYDALYEFIANKNNTLINSDDLELYDKLVNINKSSIKDELEQIEIIFHNYYYNLSKKLDETLFIYLNFNRFVKNLNTLLKFKLKDESSKLPLNIILKENIIDEKEWSYLLESSEKEIVEKFGLLYYGKLEKGIINFFETNSLNLLENQIDIVFDDIMLKESFNHSNLAPTIHYIYLKLREYKKLRWAYYE